MQATQRLLVIGGATVGINTESQYVTKVPIADYLQELAQHFGGCVWVTKLHEGYLDGGILDPRLIRVIALASGRRNYARSWVTLASFAYTDCYVLYYLPNPYLPIFSLIRHNARRVVVYLANDYEMTLREFAASKWPGWPFLFRLAHEVPLRAADAVIVRGKRLAGLVRRLNPIVYETVPIGYMQLSGSENSRATNTKESDTLLRVLYVGKLLKSKGVDVLIRAMQQVVEHHCANQIALDLIGQGEDRAELERLVQDSGLAEMVTFHGWIGSERVIDRLYRRADVLVVPTTTYPEGVPRVIDEALMRGVPVVATCVGGIPEEFAEDEVMLVNPGKPEQLAGAIEIMLFDEATRRHYLDGAKRRQKMWMRWSSAAKQHTSILLGEGM